MAPFGLLVSCDIPVLPGAQVENGDLLRCLGLPHGVLLVLDDARHVHIYLVLLGPQAEVGPGLPQFLQVRVT
jgi:hypothetical protein